MSKYVELPIDQIELDKSNPRIANYLATHDEDDITSDLMALLLGTTSDSCASLRQSIEANYGIIHPIVVNKRVDGTYLSSYERYGGRHHCNGCLTRSLFN